jgi:hypothetical protein
MTKKKSELVELYKLLLKGNYMRTRMNNDRNSVYVVYTGNQLPIRYFKRAIGDKLKDYLKTDSKGRMTLNLSSIRQLDGRSFMKKTYKKDRTKNEKLQTTAA